MSVTHQDADDQVVRSRAWLCPSQEAPGTEADLEQLVCDGKTLRGSIETTAAGGGSAFIAKVTLYSADLDFAINQVCYATSELDLEGALIQAYALNTQQPFFISSRSRGPTSS